MGQNKLEGEFRKKLNAREIKPSDAAWDRLDAMLTVAEEKKPKPLYNWLYIAAGFVGFILLAAFLFNTINKGNESENAVATEGTAPTPLQKPVMEESIPEEMLPVKQTQNAVASSDTKEKKDKGRTNATTQNTALITNKVLNENPVTQNVVAAPQPNEINQKTTINQMKTTDADVDGLLAAVEKSSGNQTAKPQMKVDAGTLLSQVDGELELSFREKVIRSASRNYKNVKVALANRNQE